MGGELRLCVFIGVGKEHFLLLSSSSPPEGGVGVATAGGSFKSWAAGTALSAEIREPQHPGWIGSTYGITGTR